MVLSQFLHIRNIPISTFFLYDFQIEYGMNDNGNFREQSTKNMQRAVCSGKLTIPDYFDKEIELKIAGKYGIDDGNSCLKGIFKNCFQFHYEI